MLTLPSTLLYKIYRLHLGKYLDSHASIDFCHILPFYFLWNGRYDLSVVGVYYKSGSSYWVGYKSGYMSTYNIVEIF